MTHNHREICSNEVTLTELPDDDDDDDEREAKEVPRQTQAALETSYPPGSPLCRVSLELYCLDCEV